jgi:hypothetical protein
MSIHNRAAVMLVGLQVLDEPQANHKLALARRQAVFDIEKHDPRGDSLLDELSTMLHQRRSQLLLNFEAGDGLETARMIDNVIFSVADDIRRKHGGEA